MTYTFVPQETRLKKAYKYTEILNVYTSELASSTFYFSRRMKSV